MQSPLPLPRLPILTRYQWACFFAFSIKILFIISATSFCWGVYGLVFSRAIPKFLQNSSNSFLQSSPPLSVLYTYIFFFVWFSTRALNSLNMLKTSDFFLKKYIHVFLENSSMNETLYTDLPSDGSNTGANTSLCTSSNILFALLGLEGKLTRFFFPYTQCS